MQEIKQVMQLLIVNAAPLPPEYLDHPLKGQWRDFRDCHIRGDWILIYRLIETADGEEVVFTRTGSHAEVFK
jgi:mRNA interferase YafQ